jgi:hypothetical protein
VEIENLSYQIERSTTHNRGVRIARLRLLEMQCSIDSRTSKINDTSSNDVDKRCCWNIFLNRTVSWPAGFVFSHSISKPLYICLLLFLSCLICWKQTQSHSFNDSFQIYLIGWMATLKGIETQSTWVNAVSLMKLMSCHLFKCNKWLMTVSNRLAGNDFPWYYPHSIGLTELTLGSSLELITADEHELSLSRLENQVHWESCL